MRTYGASVCRVNARVQLGSSPYAAVGVFDARSWGLAIRRNTLATRPAARCTYPRGRRHGILSLLAARRNRALQSGARGTAWGLAATPF